MSNNIPNDRKRMIQIQKKILRKIKKGVIPNSNRYFEEKGEKEKERNRKKWNSK